MDTTPTIGHAIVRRPAISLTRACELTHIARQPIDFAGILAEHAAYCDALREAGLSVEILDAVETQPDSVFVEDSVVVLGALAILTRPGAISRRTEPEMLLAALSRRHTASRRIEAPGTLDGGDVLAIGATLYVGRSTRSNAAGLQQLESLATPLGYRTVSVDVHSSLHLKTACTALDDSTVLINPAWLDASAFAHLQRIEVASGEDFAANALRVGQHVIANTAYPATWDALARHCAEGGMQLQGVRLHEFGKAEAGLTCLSAVFPATSN